MGRYEEGDVKEICFNLLLSGFVQQVAKPEARQL